MTDALVLAVFVAIVLLIMGQGVIQWRITQTTQLLQKEIAMAFEELKQAIERAKDVQHAAVVMIQDLAKKLNDLAQHPDAEEMRRLARELHSRADELASAIAEHEENGEGEEKPEPAKSPRK